MKALLSCAAALILGQSLATDYERASRLRVDVTSSFSMETTSMTMERDGEPVESPRGGGGSTSKETRHVVLLDEYVEKKEGAPVHVRRTFETIDSEGTIEFGERSMEISHETPLEGVAIDITVDEEGEVAVEVAEGDADDELLEGHLPGLALDAFLPADDVEQGDAWDLDSAAIRRALAIDVEPLLFRRPEAPEEEPTEGRRGGRGGFGRGGGGGPAPLFQLGEWEGKATLESLSEEHEGVTCAAIQLELECAGDIPEQESGGRDRELALGFPRAPAADNEFEMKAEGRLLFSLADGRPILLELEGKVSTDRRVERTSERGSFVMTSTQEGTFTVSIQVAEAKSE